MPETVMVLAGGISTAACALLVLLLALRARTRQADQPAEVERPASPRGSDDAAVQGNYHQVDWSSRLVPVSEILRREAADAPAWPAPLIGDRTVRRRVTAD